MNVETANIEPSSGTPFLPFDDGEKQYERYIGSVDPIITRHYITKEKYVHGCTDFPCAFTIDITKKIAGEETAEVDIPLWDYLNASIFLAPKDGIDLIRDKYIIDNYSEVTTFLNKHYSLIETLMEIPLQIERIFGKNIKELLLVLDRDPEEDFEGLTILVMTDRSPETSLDLLDKFDEEWWLDLDAEIRNKLTVMVRPI